MAERSVLISKEKGGFEQVDRSREGIQVQDEYVICNYHMVGLRVKTFLKINLIGLSDSFGEEASLI